MKRKPAAQRNIGIDLDAAVIDQFSCVYPVELTHGYCHEYLLHNLQLLGRRIYTIGTAILQLWGRGLIDTGCGTQLSRRWSFSARY